MEVIITKDIIEKEWFLLLFSYLGYNVYHIYRAQDGNLIRPWYTFGNNYIKRYIESLVGTNKDYPEIILSYFKENNRPIIIPEKFKTIKIET